MGHFHLKNTSENNGRRKTARYLAALTTTSVCEPQIVESIAVCRPLLPRCEDLLPYLQYIDDSRQYSNHGGLVRALQSRLRAATGHHAQVALAGSGTGALSGAILAAAGRADPRRPLCLVPAYTFIGTISAIEQCGFTPHFMDVDLETWLLDPERCRDHPLIDRVGLVVPVATYGRPVPQASWTAFRAATGIEVAIDGAAAIESIVNAPHLYVGGIPVAVSFHATKAFCTGEGGAVFCSDVDVWRAAIESLNFGYSVDRASGRPSINGKMSEYHAAVGLAELDRWAQKVRRYAEIVQWYREASADVASRLHMAPTVASNYVLVETSGFEHTHSLMLALEQSGIGCRKWYGPGAHRQPYCEIFDRDDLPHSESLASRLIGLPMAPDLGQADVARVVDVIRGIEHGATRERCESSTAAHN